MEHIGLTPNYSPFVSLSKSMLVAEDYARGSISGVTPSVTPGYVYVIEIPDPVPDSVRLWDPIKILMGREFAREADDILRYHHNGAQGLLEAIAGGLKPASRRQISSWSDRYPEDYVAQTITISEELKTILWAIRDAEILASGKLDPSLITERYVVGDKRMFRDSVAEES